MENRSADTKINTLVHQHADMVYRLALLHMKNTSDAEDVFQDVFLRLVKHLSGLENEEHIKAWLIRVTINCCKSQLTGSWRRKVVATDQQILEETIEGQAAQPASGGPDIQYIVKTLPIKYRNVIHLFYFEDLSITQISQVLQIKEGTIKGQLSRGREMIKRKMTGEALHG